MRVVLLRGVALLVLSVGCTDPLPGPPTLGTHVDDWRDEIIYQVLTDRFSNGEAANDTLDGVGLEPSDLRRHQGGDWQGLASRLDYIERLGATAIWISPVVANVDRTDAQDGYHGYWARDFTQPNPRFGDLEALRSLVRAAHTRGLLVMVDIVTNHAGRVFDYDLDEDGRFAADVTGNDAAVQEEAEPPFRAEGYGVPLLWRTEPPRLVSPDGVLTLRREHFGLRGRGDLTDPTQKVLGDFPSGLRDLETTRSDIRDAMVETYVRWVRDTDVDGFRIDVVPHVEPAFWPIFCQRVRDRLAALGKRRFFMVGEVFLTDPSAIAPYTADGGVDAAFDLPFKYGFVDHVVLDGAAPASAVPVLEAQRAAFPTTSHPNGIEVDPWSARVAIVDNHDTARIRGELDRPDAAELALAALFTLDAIPAVYYGTEQGFAGTSAGDGQRERLWDTGFPEDGRTFLWIQKLVALRTRSVALRRGDLLVRFASEHDGRSEEDDAGMIAWERAATAERALVVLNAHALKTSSAAIPTAFAPGTELIDALHEDARSRVVGADAVVRVTLGPREAAVFFPR